MNFKYPWLWGIDIESPHCHSLWLGWWLVTWWVDEGFPLDLEISFQPGL